MLKNDGFEGFIAMASKDDGGGSGPPKKQSKKGRSPKR